MANHPNRARGPYTAEMGGSAIHQGPKAEFATIREARRWAEEYGGTADYCLISDAAGRLVASHRRDTNCGRWFRATI